MAFWNRRKKKEERDSAFDENSVEAALLSALIGDGESITFEEALQIPAVAASIDFISTICARVPVKLYKENGEDTEEITADDRVYLLNDETGDLLNAYQMKKAWVTDYFNGQGYIYINRERRRIRSLHYVEKQYVSIVPFTNPIFKDADIFVNGMRYYPFDFLRLCRNTKDGVTGVPITETNSRLLSLYYATLKFEQKLMKTGGGKKGFLTSEKRLGEEALEKIRSVWRRIFEENRENMMVLNQGMDFKEASATSTELQLNENKRTNANDITLLFLLSPKALQGASDDEIVSAIKTACIPIIEQMEAAFNAGLLLESEKRSMYFSCDTSTLERGDILKRYQAYEIAIKSHFMQADEIRYKEDMKPLGLDWIELGLDSVLYNPETKEIYTPNTNQTATVEGRSEDDYIQDPETGQMQGRRPSGDSGDDSSGDPGLTSGGDSGIIEDKEIARIRDEVIPSMDTSTLSPRQAIHRQGTEEYKTRQARLVAKGEYGPSYLTISDAKALELANRYKGTGIIKLNKEGKWNGQEVITDNDEIVGVVVNNLTGVSAETTVFKIHYAEDGIHIVPDYPSKKKGDRP